MTQHQQGIYPAVINRKYDPTAHQNIVKKLSTTQKMLSFPPCLRFYLNCWWLNPHSSWLNPTKSPFFLVHNYFWWNRINQFPSPISNWLCHWRCHTWLRSECRFLASTGFTDALAPKRAAKLDPLWEKQPVERLDRGKKTMYPLVI